MRQIERRLVGGEELLACACLWMRNTVVGLTIALALAGCLSAGRPFNMAAVSQLQPGVTTETEAVALVGVPPTWRGIQLHSGNPANTAPGDYFIGWQYATASLGGGKNQELLLQFSKDQVFKQVVKQSGIDTAVH